MNMRKINKIVSIALLIICFTSTLMACSNSNNVTDNNETTTVTDNETNETTTKETEEPTTTEHSTEYVYKGKKFTVYEGMVIVDKLDNLTLEKDSKLYINDVFCDTSEFEITRRGNMAYTLIVILFEDKNYGYLLDFQEKYWPAGSPKPMVTYEDNFYIEYIYDDPITFHYIETVEGDACFDVY